MDTGYRPCSVVSIWGIALVQEILIKLIPPSPEQRMEIEKMSDNEVVKRVYQMGSAIKSVFSYENEFYNAR